MAKLCLVACLCLLLSLTCLAMLQHFELLRISNPSLNKLELFFKASNSYLVSPLRCTYRQHFTLSCSYLIYVYMFIIYFGC